MFSSCYNNIFKGIYHSQRPIIKGCLEVVIAKFRLGVQWAMPQVSRAPDS